VIIAAVVLIGGWAGLPLLASWGAGFPPMRPAAALCIAALGIALMHPGDDSRFAFAAGLAVVAAAAVGLGLILFNIDPGIDPLPGAAGCWAGTGSGLIPGRESGGVGAWVRGRCARA